jgi:rhomboid family GlyGly-CTERM serine protease
MGLSQGGSRDQKTGHLQAWAPIMIIAVGAGILGLIGDPARDLLAYDRPAIAAGEWWRVFSAHFVHLGTSHLVLNLAGLVLVWYLVGQAYSQSVWAAIWLVSIGAVTLGLWLFEPQLTWYVGLSGVLHGLLAAGILGTLQNRAETWMLGFALIAKLAWEQLVGPLPGSESTSGGTVIVDAHLFGALGGIASGVLIRVSAKGNI